MIMSDDDDAITFNLPHPASTRSLPITLLPWSRGLRPVHIDEYLTIAGEAVREHFIALWKMDLATIQRQVDPVKWQIWRADIPTDLISLLRHHGLNKVGALYLLCQVPDMQQALCNGPFFSALLECWVADINYGDMAFANRQLHRKLALRRHEALRLTFDNEVSPCPVSPLRIRLLGLLPASFRFRGNPLGLLAFQDYDAFLPNFFSSRRRFKEKLGMLEAFHWACLGASISFEDAIPLFGKALRQNARVRSNNLAKLFVRLVTIHRRLGKGSIRGLLQGAPSLQFLEKYLRRQEKLFMRRRELGLLPVDPDEFPDPALPTITCLEPLLSRQSLAQEGTYMGNCIESYAPQIEYGSHAAYRMRWPVRGTVLLHRMSVTWSIVDARVARDAPMGKEGLDLLLAWMAGLSVLGIPEDLPPYYPEAASGDITYSSLYPDNWDEVNQIPEEDFDEEEEWFDARLEELNIEAERLEDTMPDVLPTHDLPDALVGWVRINRAEQLERVGFDSDMLTASHMAVIHDPAKVIYVHPAFTLAYVVIHHPDEPAHSIEVVRYQFAYRQGMSFKGSQLVELLRNALENR